MDPRGFDAIVRSFGASRSRRLALGALVGAGLGLTRPVGSSQARGACRVVGKRCRRPEQCCTPICTNGKCRCPDGRKACGKLCCGAAEACKNGKCCSLNGEICPPDPSGCCSGECSAGHHCCIIKGACQADVDCCFVNQACRDGRCCFLPGAVCGAGERCCSGVCNSSGICV